MRLFAAVVPPPDALDHLERALDSVRAGLGTDAHDVRGPLRWTVPEDRHLTVAFYGEVPEGYLDELTLALHRATATTPPFEVSLRGAGLFDRRTLWIGCGGQTGPLADLMAAAVDVGREVLGRTDDRVRSRAHLTVARVRSETRRAPGRPARRGEIPARQDDAGALAHALAVYQGPTWTVREVVLVASELGGGASGSPRHTVVSRFPLPAVAG